MSRPSFVYALVEDKRQRQLIYRFLLKVGLNPRQLEISFAPAGHGSAEKWVGDNFAREVGKCRARNARASTGMIVMIDADTGSLADRQRMLEDALASAGQSRLDSTLDPIARLIPKRNVETWILCLSATNTALDEEQDYKQTRTDEGWSTLIPTASETLYQWMTTPNNLPANLIDSLRRGINELPRALIAKG